MAYCSAPFNSIRIEAVNETTALYKPCCLYNQSDINYLSVVDYLHSSELAELKQHFDANAEIPKSCNACYRQEQQGQVSLRQHFNSKFNQAQKITQLEIFPSNVCNLKCFMCDSNFSTALAAEQKKLNFINDYREIDNVDLCFDAINDLQELTDVSFIGGEFFLTKKNLEILDLLIQRQLNARVVTNGTVILPAHIERLKKIPKLELQVSLDGIGQSYEFMRYPAKWETVDYNIQYLKRELSHAKLNFNFVVQPLNVQYVIPTLDYANKLLIPTRLTNLIGPSWLTWAILTDTEKQKIIELLEQQKLKYKITGHQKQQIANYQKTLENTEFDSDLRGTFSSRLNKILAHRQVSQEKIRNHLAELPDLLS